MNKIKRILFNTRFNVFLDRYIDIFKIYGKRYLNEENKKQINN
jgi:hypothetical protein